EGIVKEITDVVMEKVKAKGLDFVLDKSGISINGVPVVMYAPENVDFTNEIIETMNKPGRATASTKKPAAAPTGTPAPPKAKPCSLASDFKDTRGLNSRVFFCTGEILYWHADGCEPVRTSKECLFDPDSE